MGLRLTALRFFPTEIGRPTCILADVPRWRKPAGIFAALVLAASVLPAPAAQAYWYIGGPAIGAPTLVSPIDGETITSAPVLRWLGGVNARQYEVRVWAAGNPDDEVCDTGGPFTWARCQDIPPGTYEWSVQSFDVSNHGGGTSAVGSFTRAAPEMAAPVLITPSNGAVVDYPDSAPILQWAPAAGAEFYQIQVSTSPTLDEGEPHLQNSSAILKATLPLEHIGEAQYWRVRGVNAAQTWAGPWSATRSFTVTWSDVPTPTAPADGASASNIFLEWSPEKGASRYEIEVTSIDDTDFSDAILTWEERTWTGWGAIPAGDLRWRVRARNDHGGVTAWSTASTIHRDDGALAAVQPDPLEPPDVTLASPADGAAFPSSAAEVPLAWTSVAGALRYELDVRNVTGDWYRLGLTFGSGPIRWTFDPGGTYEWRVRAVGENNVLGDWSDVRTLTIADPAPLTLLSPADGEDLPASSQVVAWQAVTGSFNYRVEIDDDPDFGGWQDFGAYRNPVTSASLDAWEPGRWYWRVRAGVNGTDALSEVRAVDVIDDVAPAGSVGFQGLATMEAAATLSFAGADGFGEVTEVQASADGATWETFAMPPWGELQVGWSLTSPAHGGPDPGQRHVHAKFRDDAGNWSPILSASIWYGMAPPTDDMGPSGTITIADGAEFTGTHHPLIDIPATDVHGVTTIALSTDGVTWVERPYWPTQQVTLPESNGVKTVSVKWRDGRGNWSGVAQDTIVVGGPENVDPEVTEPGFVFGPGATRWSGRTQVKFTWTGSDSGTGIARYQAAISRDGGAWSTISTNLASPQVKHRVASGHSYRLRVRAIDNAGNVGAWVIGKSFTVAAYQEGAGRLDWHGSWTRRSNANHWGERERVASEAGARMTFTFTGRDFAWIGAVGPKRGSANIYVDGNLVRTVDLYAASPSYRHVLVSLSWATSTSRKIRIVVVGTPGHPRVGIDAIVTGS